MLMLVLAKAHNLNSLPGTSPLSPTYHTVDEFTSRCPRPLPIDALLATHDADAETSYSDVVNFLQRHPLPLPLPDPGSEPEPDNADTEATTGPEAAIHDEEESQADPSSNASCEDDPAWHPHYPQHPRPQAVVGFLQMQEWIIIANQLP